jgi:hypothetical protein
LSGWGALGGGTFFEMIHKNGKWTHKVLINFGYGGTGPIGPDNLIFDKAGKPVWHGRRGR